MGVEKSSSTVQLNSGPNLSFKTWLRFCNFPRSEVSLYSSGFTRMQSCEVTNYKYLTTVHTYFSRDANDRLIH